MIVPKDMKTCCVQLTTPGVAMYKQDTVVNEPICHKQISHVFLKVIKERKESNNCDIRSMKNVDRIIGLRQKHAGQKKASGTGILFNISQISRYMRMFVICFETRPRKHDATPYPPPPAAHQYWKVTSFIHQLDASQDMRKLVVCAN